MLGKDIYLQGRMRDGVTQKTSVSVSHLPLGLGSGDNRRGLVHAFSV